MLALALSSIFETRSQDFRYRPFFTSIQIKSSIYTFWKVSNIYKKVPYKMWDANIIEWSIDISYIAESDRDD